MTKTMWNYPGSKAGAGVYQKIINLMPPHRVYIEPFLGGGAILRQKRPASSSIGIDSDEHVLEMWTACDIPGAEIHQGDALEFLGSYSWKGDELVYCDPPYLMETRSTQRDLYRHEFASMAEHAKLLSILAHLPAMVMISGYWHKSYLDILSGWRIVKFEAMTRGGHTATECVWLNFPEPLKLHDYRYLGENFRQRERIKRRQQRWRSRLKSMPALERRALLSVIQELELA